MAQKLAELRAMSDAELAELYDRTAHGTVIGLNFISSEIARREDARRTRTMLRLTWVIAFMTFVVTVATIVNVWILVKQE